MKEFKQAPDMPKFIPNGEHIKKQHYCSPFYPMPPVPSVVGGNGEMDLYESMNVLNDRVNMCISTYNDVMAECYKTLHNLIKAGEENGAYYAPDCVFTEEGYDADSNAMYKLVHKRSVDRHGEPIRIKMHLAYGNTTNSNIEQNILDASKVEYADKIFIAQPKNDSGWYGKVIFNGAPLPSAENTSLYTVGFTRHGKMRVYSNATDINTIINDGIENAMGCSGVLIQGGEICSESWYNTIPNYDEKTSRICMGQNIESGEVIWLAVGKSANEGHEGMTSLKCAEILRAYGCSIAVEICEGENSGGLDKGSMLYKPENNEAQGAYAFWYISRKCFYKNDYERELAELIQNYAANIWLTYLNTEKIKNLYKDLQDEIVAREEADTLLQSNIDAEAAVREAADIALDVRIDNEETAREEADEVLQENIDAEESARIAADNTLQANINAEATARQNADNVLQDNIDDEARIRRENDTAIGLRIDAEAEARQQADASLSTRLETEVAARTAEDTRISTALENEVLARQSADADLRNRIDAEATARQNADATLQDNIDAEATARANGDSTINTRIDNVVSALQTWVNGIVDSQNAINQQINSELSTLQDTVNSQAGTLTLLLMRVSTLEQTTTTLGNRIDAIIDGSTFLPYLPLSGGNLNGDLIVPFNKAIISGNINLAGNTISHASNADNLTIKNLAQPTNANEATNKNYVDTAISTAVGTLNTDVSDLQDDVDDIVDGTTPLPYVAKSGDTMSGDLNMGGHDIISGGEIIASDITTTHISGADNYTLQIDAGQGGDIYIQDLTTPINNNDAANKKYVDDSCLVVENYVNRYIKGRTSENYTDSSSGLTASKCNIRFNCLTIELTNAPQSDTYFLLPVNIAQLIMQFQYATPSTPKLSAYFYYNGSTVNVSLNETFDYNASLIKIPIKSGATKVVAIL